MVEGRRVIAKRMATVVLAIMVVLAMMPQMASVANASTQGNHQGWITFPDGVTAGEYDSDTETEYFSVDDPIDFNDNDQIIINYHVESQKNKGPATLRSATGASVEGATLKDTTKNDRIVTIEGLSCDTKYQLYWEKGTASGNGGSNPQCNVVLTFNTGHNWGDVTYEWSDDNSTVTATRTCKNDALHTENETVGATSEVTKAATKDAEGMRTWTSKAFTNEAFAVQTKTEAIPKLTEDAKTDNGSNQGSNATKDSGSNGTKNDSTAKDSASNGTKNDSTAKGQASKKIKVGPTKIGSAGSYKNKSLKVKIKKKAKNATIYRYSIRKANAKTWTNKWSKKKTYTFKRLKDKELYQLKAAGYRGKKGIKGADSKISYRYMSAVLKKAKGGKGKVTAIWKKDSKASGYEIRYATSKKAIKKAKITKIGKGKTTKVIKGLAKGKTYYVQVRPYKNYKGNKYNGIWWTKKAKVQ